MLNLSSLFNSETDGPTLLGMLELSGEQREFILEAKSHIRTAMRDGLQNALQSMGHVADGIEPRFFTQGSYAYKTLNAPAHASQQADIDDGAYLPMSFVADTGRPSIASASFFKAAETALTSLVQSKRWRLVVDKATCVRVEVAQFAHVDIPLYAIPDVEFVKLEKAARLRNRADARVGGFVFEGADEDSWVNLPSSSVLLAHRQKNWFESDPRPIKAWFLGEVERLGEQFRRCVRYLKAFRDQQWEAGGPSSILLMVAAAPLFEKRDRRDDVALADLLSKLPDAIRTGVCNPMDARESLTERLGDAAVELAARKLERLHGALSASINSTSATEACSLLVDQFGPRFPVDSSRIKPSSVASAIATAPASAMPSPIVGRTKAG